MTEHSPENHPGRRADDKPKSRLHLRERVGIPRWAAAVLLAMSLAVCVQSISSDVRQKQCNIAFAQNLEKSRIWAGQDRAALHHWLVTIYENPADDNAEIQAFHRYVRTYDRNTLLRRGVIGDLPELASCDQ